MAVLVTLLLGTLAAAWPARWVWTRGSWPAAIAVGLAAMFVMTGSRTSSTRCAAT